MSIFGIRLEVIKMVLFVLVLEKELEIFELMVVIIV